MELIGKKVRGFKFENRKYGNLLFDPEMCNFIGKFGTITEYHKDINRCAVIFEDCTRWIYPAELIKEHLVTDKQVDTITLPLINGVPDLSEFEGVEMLVSDDEVNWHEKRVLFYSDSLVYPYRTYSDKYKYAKPLLEKKKITAEDIKKMFNCDDFEIV